MFWGVSFGHSSVPLCFSVWFCFFIVTLPRRWLGKHLQNDLCCVEWDIKCHLSQSIVSIQLDFITTITYSIYFCNCSWFFILFSINLYVSILTIVLMFFKSTLHVHDDIFHIDDVSVRHDCYTNQSVGTAKREIWSLGLSTAS